MQTDFQITRFYTIFLHFVGKSYFTIFQSIFIFTDLMALATIDLTVPCSLYYNNY